MHVTPASSCLFACTGALIIEGLEYSRSSLSLTCTTSGRPVHSITWLKDGTVVSTEFRQAQTITNALSATYQYTLTSGNITNLMGSFTCMAGDAMGNTVRRTHSINGIQYCT